MAIDAESHMEFANRLRNRVGGDGLTNPELRISAMLRAGGGPAIAEPYDALAEQIGQAAYRVTDAQVSAVTDTAGSEKKAFEVVLSASIGAGLVRWDAAMHAIDGASDATA
jgi:hypothetical protein